MTMKWEVARTWSAPWSYSELDMTDEPEPPLGGGWEPYAAGVADAPEPRLWVAWRRQVPELEEPPGAIVTLPVPPESERRNLGFV